jgi:hypothetical protein
MAEIDIERKPKSGGWSWALGVLLLLVVAGAGWYFFMGPGSYEGGLGPDEQPVVTFPVEPGPDPTGAGAPPPGGAVPPGR